MVGSIRGHCQVLRPSAEQNLSPRGLAWLGRAHVAVTLNWLTCLQSKPAGDRVEVCRGFRSIHQFSSHPVVYKKRTKSPEWAKVFLEGTQMPKKHMKRCFTSGIIKKKACEREIATRDNIANTWGVERGGREAFSCPVDRRGKWSTFWSPTWHCWHDD